MVFDDKGHVFAAKVVCDLDLWTHDLQNHHKCFWPYFISSWPWSLTFWLQIQIHSSHVLKCILGAKILWNSYKRFVRYCVYKLLTFDHWHTADNRMSSAANCWWRLKENFNKLIIKLYLTNQNFNNDVNYSNYLHFHN